MVQDVLVDDDWAAQLTDADRRGRTPLFWTHVAPYGEVKLDMSSRLRLAIRRVDRRQFPLGVGQAIRCGDAEGGYDSR
jgi:hypothetical protein